MTRGGRYVTVDGKSQFSDVWPWDVTIGTSAAALERCMRALLLSESTLTDHFRLGRHKLGRGVDAFLRVQVPVATEQVFRDICQPIDMRPPARLSVGLEAPGEDGHPGRSR